jgi:O-antigen chain-terminating methyltransferase
LLKASSGDLEAVVKTLDTDPNVSRIVEELKNDAAKRRRRLGSPIASERLDSAGRHPNHQVVPHSIEMSLTLDSAEVERVSHLTDRNQIRYSLDELMSYDDLDFVHNAYQAILKRTPDPEAMISALEGLRTGKLNKLEMLVEMTASQEGRAKGVRVSGLWSLRVARALCRLPLLRFIANPVLGFLEWRPITGDLQRIQNSISSRQRSLAESLTDTADTLQKSLGLLGEQKQTLELWLKRLSDATKHGEETLNEEVRQRKQQFVDRTEEIEDLRRVYNKYRTQVELTEKDLKREMDHLFRKYQEVKTELIYQTQRLGALERGSEPVTSSPARANPGMARDSALDAFFASFDEHFRGDREVVKERLRAYLPLIREHDAGSEAAPILDVACGRGEWLEVLKEEKLCASGVEINQVLVNQCCELGLMVQQAELIEYLRGAAAESLGAVSAFHIIEHLTVEDLVTFLDHTLRVLRKGGLLLLETPNPQNVLVGSCNFYFDPTHRNPIPLPVLKFLVESRGFVVVKTFLLNPSDEKPLSGNSEFVERFNQYFYGPMDYAIVARKI